MVYLHFEELDKKFCRHWANESSSAEDKVATYKLLQKDTGYLYDEAIDLIPCSHPYEATDIKIEVEEQIL